MVSSQRTPRTAMVSRESRVAPRVARRPAGRTGKPAIVLAVAVGLLIVLGGCGEEPTARRTGSVDEFIDGYAYTAALMSRHPLWDALVDLEQAVEEMGDEQWDATLPPVEQRFADVAFIESYALSDQEPRMANLRDGWRSRYPALRLPADGPGEDLEARIGWEARQAERMVERRMARARAAESRRLAQLRARLVQKHQERLTNLSIQAAIRGDEAAEAARAERERVWQVIEAELEATREACESQLAELEAQLRREAADRVAEARSRAYEVSGEREETMREAGAGLYEDMIAQMQEPWPQPSAGERSVSAEMEADPANDRLAEINMSRGAAEGARREKIELQRERMAQTLARMRAQIRTGTETAAKVVAYRNGIRLQTLPGGRRAGEDVTETVAEELEDFWSVARD